MTIQLVPLKWSDPARPGPDCRYDHIKAATPLGNFLLAWKGWKDCPSEGMGFDETPWGEVEYHGWGSIDEAKQWAQDELTRRIRSMLVGAVMRWQPIDTAPPPKEGEQCRACNASGLVVRDPDIGTDRECFVCGGSGALPAGGD